MLFCIFFLHYCLFWKPPSTIVDILTYDFVLSWLFSMRLVFTSDIIFISKMQVQFLTNFWVISVWLITYMSNIYNNPKDKHDKHCDKADLWNIGYLEIMWLDSHDFSISNDQHNLILDCLHSRWSQSTYSNYGLMSFKVLPDYKSEYVKKNCECLTCKFWPQPLLK